MREITKTRTNIEYFDKDTGKVETFSEEQDIVAYVGINSNEDGDDLRTAVLGYGNLVSITKSLAILAAEIILEADEPGLKLAAGTAFLKAFRKHLKKGNPLLEAIVIGTTVLTNHVDDDDDDEEEDEEGDEE